ncbi:hypothetical protein L7F22_040277 [Adiantum nelumboides]|nr:hypothetical protein [Adiantum nelumboides]
MHEASSTSTHGLGKSALPSPKGWPLFFFTYKKRVADSCLFPTGSIFVAPLTHGPPIGFFKSKKFLHLVTLERFPIAVTLQKQPITALPMAHTAQAFFCTPTKQHCLFISGPGNFSKGSPRFYIGEPPQLLTQLVPHAPLTPGCLPSYTTGP